MRKHAGISGSLCLWQSVIDAVSTKLFGFNLAAPALVCPACSHVSDSEGSGPWPSTDDSSPMSVDQHVNKFVAGTSSTVTTVPMCTGTKVNMQGQVGRTIDLKKIDSYVGLRRTLALLFNLNGQLDDLAKGWQLVYEDNENDELLVGDDPWEEFRSCVRSLRIVSPEIAAAQCMGNSRCHATTARTTMDIGTIIQSKL